MWLVIGYGSSLHGDDGFGRLVAAELVKKIRNEAAEVLSVQQLTPELAEPVSKAKGVIFVDACANAPAAEVRFTELHLNKFEQPGSSWDTHNCSPETIIEAAQMLYGSAPKAWLYTVGGREFGLGESLSPDVEQLVPKITLRILDHVSADY
jgi:hydrogenase maturation protease